ncbi:MAG: BrnA antitoxin family protein [Acidobacteriota bacterium]|nr:BrnA antitoxin family protein [Acidobacteriota bacterium]
MAKRKSSISKASSYQEMGEFWDTHDSTDYGDQTHEVEFTVDLKSEVTYLPLEISLLARMRALAKQRGISPETLLNLWVQEKLQKEAA